MPVDPDAIGIKYQIDLDKLINSIRSAKTLLVKFHEDLSALAKKASVKIIVQDQSVANAKAKVKNFANAIQATLDKAGNLKIKEVSKGFGSIATGDVDKASIALKALHKEMGGTRDVIPELNARFKAAESAIAKTGAAMNVAGEKGNVFMKKMNASTVALAHYRGQLSYTKDGIVSTATAETEAAGASVKATQKRAAAKAQLKQAAQAAREAADAEKLLAASANSATAQLKLMGITSKTTSAQIKALNLTSLETARVLKLTQMRMQELSGAHLGSGKATKAASAEYAILESRMPFLRDEANKGVKAFGDYRRAMDRWGQGFKYMMLSQAAWIASGAVLFGTITAITTSIKTFIDFHQDLRDAAAIVQATTTGYEKMEKAAVSAFMNSTMSLKDTTDALKILGQTGMEAADAAIALETVYKITTATGSDTATAVKFLTTAINVWKLEASDAVDVGNVLGAALNYSKLEAADLGTVFNYVASMAKSLGMSYTDLAATAAVMSNAGIRVSTIGTGLRGVFSKLLSPTKKFRTQLELAGLTVESVNVRTKDFFTVLKNLQTAGFDIGNIFKGMSRREAASLNVMLEQGVERFNLMREALKDTTAVEVMFERSMRGMKNQIILTGHAIQQFLIGGLGALKPIITGTASFIRELFISLDQLRGIILTTAAAWAIYKAAQIASATATDVLIASIFRLKTALFDFTQRHPFFIALTIMVAGYTAVKMAVDKLTTSIKEQRNLLNRRIDDMRKLQILMVDSNRTEEEKLEIMDAFVKDYPELLDALKHHKISIEDIIDATKRLIDVDKGRRKDLDLQILKEKELYLIRLKSFKMRLQPTGEEKELMSPLGPIKIDIPEIIKTTEKEIERLRIKLGLINVFEMPLDPKETKFEWTDELQKELERIRERTVSEREKAKIELEKSLEIFKATGKLTVEAEAKIFEARARLRGEYQKKISEIDKKEYDEKRKAIDKEFKAFSKQLDDQRKKILTFEKDKEDILKNIISFTEKINSDLVGLEEDSHKRQIGLQQIAADKRMQIYDQLLSKAKKFYDELWIASITDPMLAPMLQAFEFEYEEIVKAIDKIRKVDKGEKKQIIDPSDFSRGIIDGLRDARKELADEYNIWKNLAKNTAMSMRDSFSDLFFDSMNNQLKSLTEYWKAFTNAVKRNIADIAATWVTSGLFGKSEGGGLLGLIGGAIGLIGGGAGIGAGTAGASIGDVVLTHGGGLIKRMHSGGPALKSDETLRILKENEFVIKDSSTRALGESKLNYANETGKWPQPEPSVTNVHNSYTIIAMDSESMDQALRRGGAKAIQDISLGNMAYEKERRNPIFGLR